MSSSPLESVLWQVLANGVLSGAMHGLVALGFGIVYTTCRFLPISLSVSYIAAAYGAYALGTVISYPLALPLGVGLAVLLGLAFEASVFRRLGARSAPPEAGLIAALGLSVVGTAVASLAFGRETLVYELPSLRAVLVLGPLTLTAAQILAGTVAILSLGIVVAVMRTKHGLLLRATGEAPELAEAFGVNLLRTRMMAAGLGACLVGIAGILNAADTDMRPLMGFNALLYGLVAAVIAGRESLFGYMIAGLLVGVLQHFGAWLLPAQWQDGVVFLLLFIILVVRPQGIIALRRGGGG